MEDSTNTITISHYQKYKDTIKTCTSKWKENHPSYCRDKMREAYQNNPEIREQRKLKASQYRAKKKLLQMVVKPNFIIVD